VINSTPRSPFHLLRSAVNVTHRRRIDISIGAPVQPDISDPGGRKGETLNGNEEVVGEILD
jgi:hypothetical protein